MPISGPAPQAAISSPATPGPMTTVADPSADSSELAASVWSGPASSASTVYRPAIPQASSSDETATSTR